MNLIAIILTYLFFCHPHVLLVLALLIAVFYFIVSFPAGMLIMAVIGIGILAHQYFVK